MHRMFWFAAGIVAGIWGYRWFYEQGKPVPGFESLGEGGRRLSERGREFAESGRHFVETGRQLASEGRQFAQTAVDTAQARGRDVVETVKAQTDWIGPSQSA